MKSIEKPLVLELDKYRSKIARDKGLGIDALPNSIMLSKSSLIKEKLNDLVIGILREGVISTPFKFARLYPLNKLKNGLPGLDDLRSIMVSSPIVKIIEFLALIDPERTLQGKISSPQVSFLSELNAGAHS